MMQTAGLGDIRMSMGLARGVKRLLSRAQPQPKLPPSCPTRSVDVLLPHEPHLAHATRMTLPVKFQEKMATQKVKKQS